MATYTSLTYKINFFYTTLHFSEYKAFSKISIIFIMPNAPSIRHTGLAGESSLAEGKAPPRNKAWGSGSVNREVKIPLEKFKIDPFSIN
jgi:hypothetical protein